MTRQDRADWRDAARRAVNDAIGDALLRRPALRASIAELFAIVGRSYPFGPRKGYPYRVWLRAVRDARGELERLLPAGGPLDRRCPVCCAKPGQACSSVGENDNLAPEFMSAANQAPLLRGNKAPGRIPRTLRESVMHAARRLSVEPNRIDGVVSAA